MFQLLNQLALSTRRGASAFRRLRGAVVRYYDPLVKFEVNGRTIMLPMSHELPLYRTRFPTYSDNLARLAAFLRRKLGTLRMIDVGANVGDSYHLVRGERSDAYLLIEGDPRYFPLLLQNTKNDSNVVCVQALVADRKMEQSAHLMAEGGNTQIVSTLATQAEKLHYDTIDNIVIVHPAFHAANLLKTDIEGFDTKALMGASNVLRQAQPVVFFEHHPALLHDANIDAAEIFGVLRQAGYSHAIFYDNLGILLCAVKLTNTPLLESLILYAQQKSGFYYDICCFPDSKQHLAKAFLKEERGFYIAKAAKS